RYEYCNDQSGAFRRGPGDRRTRHLRAARAGWVDKPGAARIRGSGRRPATRTGPHAGRVSSEAALLATRSAGKLRELRPLFTAHGIAVIDLAEAGIAESLTEDG